MLSSGMLCYYLGLNVIIWDEMLSSGMLCYHMELMLSSGTNVLCGKKCYHLDLLLSSWANVIIWCYHVMLSSGMITPPFFIFPENFTHSVSTHFLSVRARIFKLIRTTGINFTESISCENHRRGIDSREGGREDTRTKSIPEQATVLWIPAAYVQCSTFTENTVIPQITYGGMACGPVLCL